MFFVKVLQQVAVYPYLEVEAMSRPFNFFWEFFCYRRMNTWLFFSKLTGITRQGILKELEVCDFDKTWSADQ